MNKIKALLLKDLLELKTYKKSLFIILLFYFFYIFFQSKEANGSYIGVLMIMLIFSMIPMSTFGYDERTNTSRYLNTLPISRKEMVLEKHLLTFISIILGALFGTVISIVLAYLASGNIPSIKDMIPYIMGGILGISIIDSIQIIAIYKYGMEKGRIMLYVMILGIVLIITGLSYILPSDIKLPSINNDIVIILIFTIILFIIYYISYLVSYRIYKKKDA